MNRRAVAALYLLAWLGILTCLVLGAVATGRTALVVAAVAGAVLIAGGLLSVAAVAARRARRAAARPVQHSCNCCTVSSTDPVVTR